MDFNLTKEQLEFQKVVREFAKEYAQANEAKWDEEAYCPVELIPKMGEIGVLGVFTPKAYGGSGLGHFERAIAMEEIARYSTSLAMTLNSQHLGISAILDYGTEEQKMKYLPDLCKGTKITGLAVTESHGGSDVGGQTTKAVSEGDKWVISGQKCLITNSHIADVNILTAITSQNEKGRNNFSAFIIDKDTPGFKPGKIEKKLGLRGSVTGDLDLENVVVSQDDMLGNEGQGTEIAMKEIGEIGRAGMTGICVGIIRGCLEDGMEYANKRLAYGKPLSRLPALQAHIADNRLDYEVARLMLHRAATYKDGGKASTTTDFSLAKLYAAEASTRVAQKSIEIMGGYGILKEYTLGKFMRDALTTISSGGTSEIQRVIIAADTTRNYGV